MINQIQPAPARAASRTAVPILTYHSLDDTGSVISTAPEVFRRQMESLRDWGYQGIRLSDLLEAWEGEAVLPPRPVVLTFDDGFGNVLEHAAPVLQDVGFRATVFAVAGYCGAKNDWPSQPAAIPRLPLLSWSGLRELGQAGCEIGAHGVTHAPLTQLGPPDARREILGSQAALQDGLGQAVTVFAYPYGLADALHRQIVGTHYRGACGVGLGLARPGHDRACLRRLEMYYYREMAQFRLFPTWMGPLYLALRSVGRACRAALRP
jgi:peptidoglycan/xylan/chitin deacetylase (PgdA/CDA1 family)